ncbi:branched-chain amino acid ABC transporter permease [bacterium]|nr:branched-chain amino acid ABC transporter permease [bacterium]
MLLIQLLINGIIMGAVYSLASLGFAIVYNTTKIFHIGYSALYMIAPYFFWQLYTKLGLNISLSIFVSIILTMIISILIDKTIYQPLFIKKSSSNVVTISSIGVVTIIVNVIAMIFGNETKILNSDIANTIKFSGMIVTYPQVYQFISSIIIIIIFFIVLKKTNLGIIIRAFSNNDVLVQIMGINILRTRLLLFGISGIMIAIAGLSISYDVGMDPYIGMPMLLNVIVAFIIGGIGSFAGPLIGGFFIGVIQALTIWMFSSKWQSAITFIILIIFLIFRPQGFLGKKEREV